MKTDPLYPFGYGLSYTSFRYNRLRVSPAKIPVEGTATVSVEITNTGAVAGDEVVQLYIRDEIASVIRPDRQLKGFARIRLEPGQTKTVSFEVGREELCFYGPDGEWIGEPGDFTVMVPPNSRDPGPRARLTVTP
jgi:beta-glucosidase